MSLSRKELEVTTVVLPGEGAGGDPLGVGGAIQQNKIGLLDGGDLLVTGFPEGGILIGGHLVENGSEIAGKAFGKVGERIADGGDDRPVTSAAMGLGLLFLLSAGNEKKSEGQRGSRESVFHAREAVPS